MVRGMRNEAGESIEAACHPEMALSIESDRAYLPLSVVRKKKLSLIHICLCRVELLCGRPVCELYEILA